MHLPIITIILCVSYFICNWEPNEYSSIFQQDYDCGINSEQCNDEYIMYIMNRDLMFEMLPTMCDFNKNLTNALWNNFIVDNNFGHTYNQDCCDNILLLYQGFREAFVGEKIHFYYNFSFCSFDTYYVSYFNDTYLVEQFDKLKPSFDIWIDYYSSLAYNYTNDQFSQLIEYLGKFFMDEAFLQKQTSYFGTIGNCFVNINNTWAKDENQDYDSDLNSIDVTYEENPSLMSLNTINFTKKGDYVCPLPLFNLPIVAYADIVVDIHSSNSTLEEELDCTLNCVLYNSDGSKYIDLDENTYISFVGSNVRVRYQCWYVADANKGLNSFRLSQDVIFLTVLAAPVLWYDGESTIFASHVLLSQLFSLTLHYCLGDDCEVTCSHAEYSLLGLDLFEEFSLDSTVQDVHVAMQACDDSFHYSNVTHLNISIGDIDDSININGYFIYDENIYYVYNSYFCLESDILYHTNISKLVVEDNYIGLEYSNEDNCIQLESSESFEDYDAKANYLFIKKTHTIFNNSVSDSIVVVVETIPSIPSIYVTAGCNDDWTLSTVTIKGSGKIVFVNAEGHLPTNIEAAIDPTTALNPVCTELQPCFYRSPFCAQNDDVITVAAYNKYFHSPYYTIQIKVQPQIKQYIEILCLFVLNCGFFFSICFILKQKRIKKKIISLYPKIHTLNQISKLQEHNDEKINVKVIGYEKKLSYLLQILPRPNIPVSNSFKQLREKFQDGMTASLLDSGDDTNDDNTYFSDTDSLF
eukprot:TRINITY_DN13842_c0_g1_i1.p1 TRINITY_DN13842_c0_g1~~TRINITY_DN13842_c0_g1_i1.p1  ORF type:complete len:750 (-),score=153.77 TRINITY_DN13842_c0_g1_i1:97-2346(-)